MRRILLTVAIMIWCLCGIYAEDIRVEAVVVDAATGEVLPYASVQTEQGGGTVSNIEGSFCLDADADAVVSISYVGYERLRIKASSIGGRIRLKPYSRQLAGVEVRGQKGLLTRIASHLDAGMRKHGDLRSNFFYRQLTRNNGLNSELIEAFFDGQCAYGLRNLRLVNGRSCDLDTPLYYTIMNFHLTMQVMPFAKHHNAEDYYVPLVKNAPEHYLDCYDVGCDKLVGQDSSLVYRLQFRAKPWVSGSIIEGNVFVDGSSLDLLRLDGRIRNAFITTKMADGSNVESRQDVDITLSYTTRRGFSEIETAATLASTTYPDGTVSVCRAMMFNTGQKYFKGKRRVREWSDLKQTIQQTGTDSLFWEKNEIVKRTLDEEQAVKSLSVMRLEPPSPPSDSPQLLQDMVANIQAFNLYYPQEDIYVFTDHDGYLPGETIWLSAVVLRSDSHQSTNLSKAIHISLTAADGKPVVDNVYPLADGFLDTGIDLPENIAAGTYRLCAYTVYQMNWGGRDTFRKEIAIGKGEKRETDTPIASHLSPPASNHSPLSLLFLATHSGNVMQQRIASADSADVIISAMTDTLYPGYNRFTAIDQNGDICRDTVIYHQLLWQKPTFQLIAPKGGLKPFGKIVLKMKGQPDTGYLVCVADSERCFLPPAPGYRQWLAERTLLHADGTPRHDLKMMAGKRPFVKSHLPESDNAIRGMVVDGRGKPVADVKLMARVRNHERMIKTSPSGMFHLDMRRYGSHGEKLPVSIWLPKKKDRKQLSIRLLHTPTLSSQDSHVIDCNLEYDKMLEQGNTSGDIREWLMQHDYLRQGRPVIWVVDGIQVSMGDHRMPEQMNELLTMSIRTSGIDTTMYVMPGHMGNRPPVLVQMTTARRWGVAEYGARNLWHKTFSPLRNFSFPVYQDKHPQHDTRRTLYWNPAVTTDENGEAVIEFYNNESCKKLLIRVE